MTVLTATDLMPFGSTDSQRLCLHSPWSRDEYTYATNGWVLVRTARLPDVPENSECPDAESILMLPDLQKQQKMVPLLPFEISEEMLSQECADCLGTGTPHDCPDCQCECEVCEGKGQCPVLVSVKLLGAFYNVRLIQALMALPGIQFSAKPPRHDAARFVFDGGEGAIMPLKTAGDRQIEVGNDRQ
jgi:hypothetical protein